MDKFLLKVSKRKKRRTRRNLDEIRKRTLKIPSNDEIISNNQVKPKFTYYMTSNRLTLLKKAVRSETATRSLLSKLRQERCTAGNSFRCLPTKAEEKKESNITCKKESGPLCISSKLKSPSHNYSEIEENKTSDNIILFSGSDGERVTNGVLTDSPSSSPVTCLLQRDKSLYDKFMSHIESYIHATASDFLKTESICKYKNIFRTNCSENKVNIKNKESVTPQFHINKCNSNANLSVTDSDGDISHNPNDFSLCKLVAYDNIFHKSPTLSKSLPSSSSAFYSQDSPEYFYYPHKLNQ